MHTLSPHSLSQRDAIVLRLLIEQYLETAEPVGSKAITESLLALGVSLSSATVRNTLASLDDLGLIEQPHTSAGRVPTREGLTLYVRELMQVKPLASTDDDVLKSLGSQQAGDVVTVLRETSKLISQLSHYASLVVTPLTEDVIVDSPWGVIDQQESLPLEEVRRRLALLQEKTQLLALLSGFQNAGKTEVMVGSDCGVVTSPYVEGQTILGCVGVVGPTRMDYARVVPIVESAARYIGEWLEGQ